MKRLCLTMLVVATVALVASPVQASTATSTSSGGINIFQAPQGSGVTCLIFYGDTVPMVEHRHRSHERHRQWLSSTIRVTSPFKAQLLDESR